MTARTADGDGAPWEDHRPTVSLPVLGARLTLPPPDHLAWYVGLGIMAVFELVEWPVALVVATSHAIAQRTHHRTVANLAEGAESGA